MTPVAPAQWDLFLSNAFDLPCLQQWGGGEASLPEVNRMLTQQDQGLTAYCGACASLARNNTSNCWSVYCSYGGRASNTFVHSFVRFKCLSDSTYTALHSIPASTCIQIRREQTSESSPSIAKNYWAYVLTSLKAVLFLSFSFLL